MTEIAKQLAEPFPAASIGWLPRNASGNRALAIPYIDARDVQDRLDAVVGPAGWEDRYEILPDGCVVCHLRVQIEGAWVEKVDVGSPSEQPDEHDRMKAAFSDALKRAGVKYGIGRYLYRLDPVWADFDPQRKRFTTQPQLPAHALPRADKPQAKAPTPVENLGPPDILCRRPDTAPPPTPAPAFAAPAKGNGDPKDGAELVARIKAAQAALEAKGKVGDGFDLYAEVAGACKLAGIHAPLNTLTGAALKTAYGLSKQMVKDAGK